MYRISKEFAFSASHQLDGLEEGHPCSRLHGHNYRVRLELRCALLDSTGFVLDYGKLRPFGDEVDKLDHRHLNDFFGVNPTAENLARWLHARAGDVLDLHESRPRPAGVSWSVGVSETPKTWAWFE